MKCEKCGINHANVNLMMRFNNDTKHVHLCSSCFQEMKNEMPQMNDFSQGQQDFANNFFNGAQGNSQTRTQTKEKQGGNGLLDELGTNLTDGARSGKIDHVVGRDEEIQRVIETLNRRNKNNPVLIGEPGVGKMVIAEGLALKIVEGSVPAKLMNKEVYVLDVASLVANTGMSGQIEKRMKQLIKELQEREEVILFIDEIHLLVGAGTAESSQMDAGNILKPALARGELQLIGATTFKEYRHIEKDAALERRLQPIIVN